MTFEEQFPSLKDKSCEPLRFRKIRAKFENYFIFEKCKDSFPEHVHEPYIIDKFKVYSEDDIQKHCLDKQRVKEAIEKCYENTGDNLGVVIFPDKLLKELGLE